MNDVRVQILGSGGPFAGGGRLQACILLDGAQGRVLLDCGATALVAMERFGIDPATIDAVLVTHFHGDHIGGLPFLIMESCFNPGQGGEWPMRTRPLLIAGPPGIGERVRQMAVLFAYDAAFAAMQRRGLLAFVPLEQERTIPIGPCSVTAFAARHAPEALALRVGYGGRTIAYSGDTDWTDTLLSAAADADLFICQTYTFDIPQDSMLSYRVLQEHRSRLTCRRIVLTHLDSDMHRRRRDVDELVAEDGMVILL